MYYSSRTLKSKAISTVPISIQDNAVAGEIHDDTLVFPTRKLRFGSEN